MWIQQTNNGFRMYERYTDAEGKVHKMSIKLNKNTPQARNKAQKELQAMIETEQLKEAENAEKTTLRSMVNMYLEQKEVKPSTLQNYEFAFNEIFKCFGDVLACDIDSKFCMRKLAESKKNKTTINRYIMILNCFFKWAYAYGYIDENIILIPLKVEEKEDTTAMEYLEPEELQSVLDQLQGRMPYYICKFLTLTGCRIGEATALRLSDIDDKYIHITKAYKYENGISTPKTINSKRKIHIQPELRTFLKEYKQWRSIYQLSSGIRTDLLFFTNRGTYFTDNNLLNTLKRVKCDKHLHPHIFRHTHVSLLAEQGIPLETIARRLGHKTSKITRDVYYHVTNKQLEKDEELLDKVYIM